jgi:hypothetical protein
VSAAVSAAQGERESERRICSAVGESCRFHRDELERPAERIGGDDESLTETPNRRHGAEQGKPSTTKIDECEIENVVSTCISVGTWTPEASFIKLCEMLSGIRASCETFNIRIQLMKLLWELFITANYS